MHAKCIRYRELLEEHGIEPPDDTGRVGLEELRNYRQLVESASYVMEAAAEFKRRAGTSKELMDEGWRA